MKLAKQGKITPNGVVLETHENSTVVFLTERGFDVELIKPVRTKGAKNADIILAGIVWEIKGLFGSSKRSIADHLYKASRQSPNIILDMRHFGLSKSFSIKEISKQFNIRRKIKRIKAIFQDGETIDFMR
ncbi:MAG: hypothetical protein LBM12_03275 [Candidatus Nomurabacteria bacterium]|jgi:hypothetical protein|nr:hypothetical protein [Candidatus Nomurabacteria bacterium]